MKQKQKKIYSLIAICMIFAFSSCQDDFNDNGLTKKDGVIMKNFSLTNSKKEKPNFKLLKAIDNLKNEIQNKKINNKIVYDSIYDFFYDDENGIYIENNGKNSYTFPVTRTNGDDKVEDIVFNLNQDNEYDIVLVKYDVTNQEALSLTEAEILDTDIVITDIQTKFAISCGMYIVMCDNNGSGGTGPLHVAGSGCHSSSHLSVEWVTSDCIGGGGGSSGLGVGEILTTPHGGYGSGSDIELQAYAVIRSLLLNTAQLSWINNINNYDTKIEIVKYVLSNGSSANSKSFAKQFISNSVANPNLQIDFNLSTKSPSFIDMSSVNGNTPEEIKFREIYNDLAQSPLFKQLFTNMFGTTPLFNVKFAVLDIPQTGSGYVSGKCKLFNNPNNLAPYNIIEIDRNYLLSNNNINIAQTILHECIHAFLNIKLRNPNIGLSITNINNLDIQACINTYYNGFSGNQTQHDFFINYMIPTMVNIFTDIKDQLLTPEEINTVEYPVSNVFIYATTPTIPSTKIYSQVLPWSWNNYFTHVSYSGLQNCSEYSSIYPAGSSNELNLIQYFQIAIFTFLP